MPAGSPQAATGPDITAGVAGAPPHTGPRGTALMARLELLAREELALGSRGPHLAPAQDPLLACMDWDLGVAGDVAASTP